MTILGLTPSILAVCVFVIERGIRRKYRSAPHAEHESVRFFDRRFAWIVGVALFLDFFVGVVLSHLLGIRRWPLEDCVLAGVLTFVAGYAIRLYAIGYLKKGFSYRLRVEDGQRLVTEGPYKYVRHPSYTGAILALGGIGVSSGLPPVMLLVLVSAWFLYVERIRSEESVLAAHLPGYRDYQAKTKKLLPGVF